MHGLAFLSALVSGMSVSTIVVKRIRRIPKGRPFGIDQFVNAGSRGAVAKTFSRLAESGELVRLTRGIYMRPKFSRFAGDVRPSIYSVLRIIARRNREIIQMHGAEAVRSFGLSTQMQVQPVFYTSGTSRKVKVGKTCVQLLHVSSRKLQHAGTNVGLALSALFYTGKKGVDQIVIYRIRAKMTPSEFEQLADSDIPNWMRVALRQEN
jgi:hypothetical protein